MRHQAVRVIAAIIAATLMASGVAAAAPATGVWTAVGPTAPALFGPGNLNWVRGSKVGPDGRLYMYGWFVDAGGDPTADNLAVYDPAVGSWHGLGSNGLGDGAFSSDVMDVAWLNGTLVVAGSFTTVAGVKGIDTVTAWNGSSGTRVGAINDGLPGAWVNSLAVRNGVLYAGGKFDNADGVATADNIAAWDGYHWTGLGSNDGGGGPLNDTVYVVRALADGRIFAGGRFTSAAGILQAQHIAWWDGAMWHAVGDSGAGALSGNVWDILVMGSHLYASGEFTDAGGNASADYVAQWTGTGWASLGQGIQNALGATVASLDAYGSIVIAAGLFPGAVGVANTDHVAAWNGTKWLSVGTALGGGPFNEMFDGRVSGRAVYVAGDLPDMGGVAGLDGFAAGGLPAAPSAPRFVKTTAGTRRVSLAWVAPLTTNGAAITGYVVQYRRFGTTAWRTFADGVRTTRTAVVTGLAAGITYQFRVRAQNDWGTGLPSTVVTKRAG